MSDGALDLSLSSSYESNSLQRHSRSHDPVSSDSGRASSDSTSSELHDDVKPRFISSPSPRVMPSPPRVSLPPPQAGNHGVVHLSQQNPSVPNAGSSISMNTHHIGPSRSSKSPLAILAPPPARLKILPPQSLPAAPQQYPHTTFNTNSIESSSSLLPRVGDSGGLSNPNSPEASSSLLPDDEPKSSSLSMHAQVAAVDRNSTDSRVAPIRPFKMYPVDGFNVYNSQMLPGSTGGLSPSPVGLQSIYESGSPSNFSSFPLTPLTSHLLQRKRRAELRESSNVPTSIASSSSITNSSGAMSVVGAVNSSSSPSLGVGGVSTTLSTATSSKSGDENGSESEDSKKLKLEPEDRKDNAYWDRRRKNNEAAKRSRDARRQKEEEIAMRAAYLEQENLKLRAQVAILKNETAKLHYMLYNRI